MLGVQGQIKAVLIVVVLIVGAACSRSQSLASLSGSLSKERALDLLSQVRQSAARGNTGACIWHEQERALGDGSELGRLLAGARSDAMESYEVGKFLPWNVELRFTTEDPTRWLWIGVELDEHGRCKRYVLGDTWT